jgi:hypothetical protein
MGRRPVLRKNWISLYLLDANALDRVISRVCLVQYAVGYIE